LVYRIVWGGLVTSFFCLLSYFSFLFFSILYNSYSLEERFFCMYVLWKRGGGGSKVAYIVEWNGVLQVFLRMIVFSGVIRVRGGDGVCASVLGVGGS